MPGMARSQTIRSGWMSCIFSSPSRPFRAVTTRYPTADSSSCSRSQSASSSSMTRMVCLNVGRERATGMTLHLCSFLQRQGKRHGRSLVFAAVDGDGAAMKLDKILDEAEPQARARHAAGGGRAVVTLEHAGDFFCGNADSPVRDTEEKRSILRPAL